MNIFCIDTTDSWNTSTKLLIFAADYNTNMC